MNNIVRFRRLLGDGIKTPAVLLCALLTTLPWLGAQQASNVQTDAIFAVRTQLVQIYLTVTDGGHRVDNLAASNFKVSEDGVPVDIHSLDNETVPLQVALLLDTSESMREALPFVQEAALDFVNSLRPIDRVTLIPFSTDIRCVSQLTDDRGIILQAIRNTEAHGTTKLYDALLFAMKHLSGKDGRKAIVSFSDGEDTAQTSSLRVVLNAAARYGYPIYTVGAGAGLQRESLKRILRQLAEVNSGKMFFEDDTGALHTVFEEVAAELRSAYVLSYYTQVPFDGRWHDVQIEPTNPAYRIHCRRGFYARGGGSAGLFDDSESESRRISSLALGNRLPPIQAATARAAEQELLQSPVESREIDVRELRRSLPSSPARPKEDKKPEFKVETRLVEVPVLLESSSGKEIASLGEKDFRIYEDDSPRDIALFVRAAQDQDLSHLRDAALSKLRQSQSIQAASGVDAENLKLGRFYLVLDDLMTDIGSFMQAKRAAETIIREFSTPIRPISLHFASHNTAEVGARPDIEEMMRRLRDTAPQGSRDLWTNDNIITTYEAFLIEREDKEAIELAELRFASSLSLTYTNPLGSVEGNSQADASTIELGVRDMARRLVMENDSQVTRLLTGLKAVVLAAAAAPGDFPKGIIFISSGFVVGRGSIRADRAQMLGDITALARRHGVRFYAIDAEGLAVRESIGIGANAAFLVNNPHLQSILERHSQDWQHSKDSTLNQLGAETGGRFVHNTNDLVAASSTALRSIGQLYYLGYLSQEPPDGRYHRIRISTSLMAGARVHARTGYYARPHNDPVGDGGEAAASAEESWDILLDRAREASRAGDVALLAATLEKLVRKFPDHAGLWYNLGAARLQLRDAPRAVEALQRALALSPGDKLIGSTLARGLVAAGYRDAASDLMELMIQKHPADIDLIIQMGRIFEADGKTEQAYRVYRRALDCTLVPPLNLYVLLTRSAWLLGRNLEADLFVRDYRARGGDPAVIDSWRQTPGGSAP
ncbi:MAG TPA: VWA domain-containing protein [Acidobacteriota bacterium]|nr:VWA domain-containing protein [Acidobacteriota bacterium]